MTCLETPYSCNSNQNTNVFLHWPQFLNSCVIFCVSILFTLLSVLFTHLAACLAYDGHLTNRMNECLEKSSLRGAPIALVSKLSIVFTLKLDLLRYDLFIACSCLTLCDPVDCSLPGSSVYGVSQTRILEWVAISFSRGLFPIQGWNPGLPWQAGSLLSEPSGSHTFFIAECCFIIWMYCRYFIHLSTFVFTSNLGKLLSFSFWS